MYTLGDLPRKGALLHPEREALVFEGRRTSYYQMDKRVNRLANGLLKLGFKRGDRLTILEENTDKYIEVYFAAAKAGMSITPLNYRLSESELAHIVEDSEAVCFFVGKAYDEISLKLKPRLTRIKIWVSLDGSEKEFTDYETLLANAPETDEFEPVDEDDMAVLMYTGGTTGLPKGVMLSYRNIMTGVINCNLMYNLGANDITCMILPLFHVSFWPTFCLLLAGGKVIINRKPDLNEILRLIQNERCTHMNLVPTIYGWLIQLCDIKAFDMSSLRSLSYAGSPFPPALLKQCLEIFGPIFTQGYGATETSGGAISVLGNTDHILSGPGSDHLASAGKAALCAEIKIVDINGHELSSGEIGEITTRGKHVMLGYWKNPELTRNVIRDGWYHTGDMGYLDDDGYLFLVDRKADMIVTGGENVYPKEVEDVLYEHPAVAMAAVVSAPDEKWGERVQAVITLKPDQKVETDDILDFCKKRLAGYKCPRALEIWDAIPTTPVGKILRKDVKKKFWKGKDRLIS